MFIFEYEQSFYVFMCMLFFSLKKTVRDSGEARRGRLSPRSLPDES
jgi:hypothetical protein